MRFLKISENIAVEKICLSFITVFLNIIIIEANYNNTKNIIKTCLKTRWTILKI